jgi:choline dehydrogenase-like flavoprotein
MSSSAPDPVDVLVIGAGASGAAATWRLSEAGLDVLCLEQGGWIDHDEAASTKPDWEVRRDREWNPYPNHRNLPSDYPINDDDTPIIPLMYNAVGGSTLHWACTFPRFHPSDFKVRTLDGVADDWPLDYFELEPYYDLNDRIMGVSGIVGDPANPQRPERPMPPLALGRGAMLMAQAFDRLGWHWWPAEMAVNSVAYGEGRGACNYCGPCDLGCPQRARASTDVTYWPLALRNGARVQTEARVCEITTDARGRASGALWLDADGNATHQPARAVVLAANGVGTARLLLLSTSSVCRDGLANSTGLVGKNLMHHVTGMVTGVFAEDLEAYKGPFAASLITQEFYETDLDRGAVRGLQMQLLRGDGPLGTAIGRYLPQIPWGEGHHETLLVRLGRSGTLTVTTEDLPRESNRVALDPDLVDSSGVPCPSLHYEIDENTWTLLDFGSERAAEVLTEAGATEIVPQRLVPGTGFHLMGTTKMGEDAGNSVVDRFGRFHDVENMFVVDGSTFVTCAALNPTSTIQALALRTADHIVETRRDL